MSRIEAKITLGNVAIIAQLLLMWWGAATGYSSLTNAVAQASEEVQDHETRIRSLESLTLDRLGRIEERLIAIEERLK